ncbi:hypothetical protein BDQ12DRAFT_672818 [Crucibulum laeve]|uniref:Uncharacterized protein n=1 Tax=Crucibulum laeve TaxID=68775 RepID=A0A5C3MI29_9AGAR|nr:hypothetical protein BDQ12DRAFT_672818 [Crucibulum laeve]
MPPKPKPNKPPVLPSASRVLVPTGPRHVSSAQVGKNSKQDERREKPTTARALVLRNGKHGARGTGEVMLISKICGREKLDLLAEDLVNKSKKAISVPFRIEQCLKIAESQCDAFIDDIANLREPDLFRHLIEAELEARTTMDPKKSDPSRNPSYVASMVGTRIHNTYMLASAWKIIKDTLHDLQKQGISDKNVKLKLKNDPALRDRYLVLYDIVNVLVNMSQARFSVLATTAPHYASYFKQTEGTDPSEPEIVFDWGNKLRQATLSFLDSIIIELCFPHETYPKAILYQLLHDAVDESPTDAKRFPQALWDAVGDLSVSVELQQILEAALLGPEGEEMKTLPRTMPEEFERWVDAQLFSEKASSEIGNFKDIIFPLEKTKNKAVLDNMWKFINLNYQSTAGQTIDSLWGLDGALDSTPQWSSYYMPSIKDSDDDSDGLPALALVKGKGKAQKKRLTVTNGAADDSYESMPGLQSVSNSSDDESDEDENSDEESEDESDESGYDTEQEEEIREMLREAMDTAHNTAWIDSANAPPGIDPFLQEDHKGNPFLKLLGSLRGRMFSSNPKLRTAPRTDALKTPPRPRPPPAAGKLTPPMTQKAAADEVEDEGDATRAAKKKKKKPKKKKLSVKPDEGMQTLAPAEETVMPPSVAKPAPAPSAAKLDATKKQSPTSPCPAATKPVAPNMSTASLSLPIEPTIAQSARSYLQSENLSSQKTKVKTRADHASIFSNTDKEKEKKGLLSKFGMSRKDKDAPAKHSWFSRLRKKPKDLMHQLLNTAEEKTGGRSEMKWEDFLKLMHEMGFQHDSSTAGSRVRFDPPDKRDKSITFHKPHPDSTIKHVKLKQFARDLKNHYGWTEEDFLKHV